MQADYEMADVFELVTPEQFKALGDPFRQKILALLMERAATINHLAAALQCPSSTMAHHMRVLTEAGLTKVVRTRQVRALTERYYGRTARTYFSISSTRETTESLGRQLLAQILRELGSLPQSDDFPAYTFSYARVSPTQALAFAERLHQLAQEFGDLRVAGEQMYGLLGMIYMADVPELPADRKQDAE